MEFKIQIKTEADLNALTQLLGKQKEAFDQTDQSTQGYTRQRAEVQKTAAAIIQYVEALNREPTAAEDAALDFAKATEAATISIHDFNDAAGKGGTKAAADAMEDLAGWTEEAADAASKLNKESGSGAGLATPAPGDLDSGRTPSKFRANSEEEVKQLQQLERQLRKTIEASKEAGIETDEFERELEDVRASLKGENAALVETVRSLEMLRAAKAAAGQDTAQLDARINDLRGELKTGATAIQDVAKEAKEADKGLKQAGKGAGDAKKGMKDLGSQGGDLRGVLQELTSEFPLLNRAMRFLTAPRLAGIGALIAGIFGLKKALSEFSKEENAVMDLGQALAQRGQFSEEVVANLQNISNAFQHATGIGNEFLERVFAKLVKFGADAGDLPQLAEHVKNLAGILGGGEGSLEQAALLVAKVMNGNTGALTEYGFVVDQTIPKAEQIDQIFRQIADGGGGQLEGRAKTLSGQWKILTAELGNFFEGIGNASSKTGVLQAVLFGLSETLQGLNSHMFPGMGVEVAKINNRLPAFAKLVADAKAEIDELGPSIDGTNVPMTAFRGRLEGIAHQSDETTSALNRLQQQQDRLASAELANEISKIDALRTRLPDTPANRQALNQRELEVRQRFERQQLQSRRDELLLREDERRSSVEALQGKLATAEGIAQRAQQKIEELRAPFLDGGGGTLNLPRLQLQGDEDPEVLRRLLKIEGEQRRDAAAQLEEGVTDPEKRTLLDLAGMTKISEDAIQRLRREAKIIENLREGYADAVAANSASIEAVEEVSKKLTEATNKLNEVLAEKQVLGIERETAGRQQRTAQLEQGRESSGALRTEDEVLAEAIGRLQNLLNARGRANREALPDSVRDRFSSDIVTPQQLQDVLRELEAEREHLRRNAEQIRQRGRQNFQDIQEAPGLSLDTSQTRSAVDSGIRQTRRELVALGESFLSGLGGLQHDMVRLSDRVSTMESQTARGRVG